MTEGGHVLLYAVAAAAGPLVLTATFLVLRSERPRRNGIAFLAGILLGTCIACGLGLLVGKATVEQIDSHERIEGAVALLLGLVLLVIGLRARRSSPRPESEEGSRASAILAGLRNVRPAAAFSMAVLLGLGGPKRLVFTFLAMASISEGGIGGAGDIALIVAYVVIATALVWVPVGMVIVAGERAGAILERGQSWLTSHAAVLRVWLSLGIGAALVVDGLVRLFA
jgi:Sap, sulfolipid-1-addressing protein